MATRAALVGAGIESGHFISERVSAQSIRRRPANNYGHRNE
jgi:hypothetical protein